MQNTIQGPLFKTQRIEIPRNGKGIHFGGTYVEIRNVRWGDRFGWEIEHGSITFGHSGTWGRDSRSEAFRTFAMSVEYEASHANN